MSEDSVICKQKRDEGEENLYEAFDGKVKNPFLGLGVPKGAYVNLLQNPEQFTGYAGPSAARVWQSIQQENCFGGQDDTCVEKRVFYRWVKLLSNPVRLFDTELSETSNYHLLSIYHLSSIYRRWQADEWPASVYLDSHSSAVLLSGWTLGYKYTTVRESCRLSSRQAQQSLFYFPLRVEGSNESW
jgi:Endoplasmic Reticulum Oxidoreductin 1 (ERO1)